MKKQKPRPITEGSFQIFKELDDWKIYDVPPRCWDQMEFLPRRDDVLAVYASGCQLAPTQMHGQLVSAGMDIVAVETNPKLTSKYGPEPDLNIYHLVIQELEREYDGYRYLAYGPYNFGSLQEHWPKDQESALDYYSNLGRVLPDSP